MTEDQARQRFMILNMIRLFAVAMVLAGVANVGGKFLPDLAPWFGYILIVVGAFDFFYAPRLLKRNWRNRDP